MDYKLKLSPEEIKYFWAYLENSLKGFHLNISDLAYYNLLKLIHKLSKKVCDIRYFTKANKHYLINVTPNEYEAIIHIFALDKRHDIYMKRLSNDIVRQLDMQQQNFKPQLNLSLWNH
jgi:hypothetical protein